MKAQQVWPLHQARFPRHFWLLSLLVYFCFIFETQPYLGITHVVAEDTISGLRKAGMPPHLALTERGFQKAKGPSASRDTELKALKWLLAGNGQVPSQY